ncbi:MAG: amidohydrolase family protein [Bdellovibrionales bacterium]
MCAHTEQLHRTGGYKIAQDLNAQSIEHVVQMTKGDIALLAKQPVVPGFTPGADMYLKMKYPDARTLIDSGLPVAIATDFNPGSCPTQNLSLIGVLSRLEMNMSLPEVIVAYTINSARALGLHSRVGALLPGYRSDFTVLDDSWDRLFYEVGYHPDSLDFLEREKGFLKKSL